MKTRTSILIAIFNNRKIRLSYFFILFTLNLFAQGPDAPINIQSPTAASLGKFGAIPVSYYTGTVNISVPIINIKKRGFDLPIDLSYDASGVRINSHPTIVGQNWALQAGGVITRSVQFNNDEFLGYPDVVFYPYFTVYSQSSKPGFNLRDASFLRNYAGEDMEPDLFSFNFMGKSGKFYLGNDGNWKILSDSNLEVIFNYNELEYNTESANFKFPIDEYRPSSESPRQKFPLTIYGFKLLDDQGFIYEFGYNKEAIDYSINLFNQIPLDNRQPMWKTNAWYLTKVTDPFNNIIFEFKYKRDYYIGEFFWATDRTRIKNVSNGLLGGEIVNSWTNGVEGFGAELISPVYLQSIFICGGVSSVEFNYENSWNIYRNNKDFNLESKGNKYVELWGKYGNREYYPYYYIQTDPKGVNQKNVYLPPNVDKIMTHNLIDAFMWKKLSSINYTDGRLKESFQFNYNNDQSKRLFLLSVDKIAQKNNDTINLYQFTYDDLNALPDPLSKAIDHWGYYKGKAYNDPFSNVAAQKKFYEERVPDTAFVKKGSLTKISYPTGGFSKFEYEPNLYSYIVSNDRQTLSEENGIGGGIRIKKIIDFDGNKTTTRQYKYVVDYENNHNSTKSSGILLYKPCYYWDNWKLYADDNHGYREKSLFSITSIIPLSNSFDAPMSYSKVIEEFKSDDGSNIGYSIYDFSSFHTIKDEKSISPFREANSPYTKYSNKGFMRGKLMTKRTYDEDNKLVHEIKYKYRSDSKLNSDYILSGSVNQEQLDKTDIYVYWGDFYKIFYSRYDLSETEESVYDGRKATKTTKYEMKDYILPLNGKNTSVRLLKQKSVINSNGEIISEQYDYPMDLPDMPYCNQLISSFRINKPVRTYTKKNEQLIKISKTIYNDFNGVVAPFQRFTGTNNENNMTLDITYSVYDGVGNPLEYIIGGTKNTIMFGYGRCYPIAVINNLGYDEIRNINPSYYDMISQSTGNSDKFFNDYFQKIRKDTSLKNAHMKTYTYIGAGKISTETNEMGLITSYLYDNFNRLSTIIDHNGKVIKKTNYNFYQNSKSE